MAFDQDGNGQLDIKTSRNQFIKTWHVYDGSFRLTDTYEVATDAVNGTPCFHTEYVYDGASTRIIKTKESRDVWDSTWDV